MRVVQTSFRTASLLAVVIATASLAACDKPHESAPHTEMEKPVAQCPEAKHGGPEEVVRTLYDQYPLDGRKIIKNEPKNVLKRFFDRKVTELLVKNNECEKSGDMCDLTFDIMSSAGNASSVSDARVCTMDAKTHTVVVQYKEIYAGSERTGQVTYQLTRTKAGWRISNIFYLHGAEREALVKQN